MDLYPLSATVNLTVCVNTLCPKMLAHHRMTEDRKVIYLLHLDIIS